MMRYVFDRVQCPYIYCTDKNLIKCEGAFKKTKISTEFSRVDDKEEFFNNVCCDRFDLCPVYRMVTKEKYEKDH